MDSQIKKINRNLITGWMVIVGVLFVAYCGEVLKGERTLAYLVAFTATTALPAFFCLGLYLYKPDMVSLRYYIVPGYFLMYIFSMLTGSTVMVFSYILPMLSLLILYHQPKLILYTGATSLVINIVSVGLRFYKGEMNLANSKDVEIQLALLTLCFGGSYMASKLYDEITKQNVTYLDMLSQKNRQMQEVITQSMMTIANTVDAKEEYTRGHSSKVSEYSAALAKELGMTEEEVENIRYAALLHDIGKVGIPDTILNKKGALTDEEFEIIKQHTVVGSEILKGITIIPEADSAIKHHHERYDGRGYPDGLVGEEIPLAARIIAAADAYEAMSNKRVYRNRLSSVEIMEELRKGIATQFDPVVAQALIRLVEEDRLKDPLTNRHPKDSEEVDEMRLLLNRVMKKREEQRKGRNRYDSLTGCYNRSHGERKIRSALGEGSGSLLLVKIDQPLEDAGYGFLMSDLWMKTVAECMEQLRAEKIVSRFGEDQFVVYLKNICTENGVLNQIEELRKQLEKRKAEQESLQGLTVSVGVVCGGRQEAYSTMLRRADKALYYARQQGRGSQGFYHRLDRKIDSEVMADKDMEILLRFIRNRDGSGEALRKAYPELEKLDAFIKRAEASSGAHRMQLLLFTLVSEKKFDFFDMEGQYWVMNLLEKAVLSSINMGDMTMPLSSSQRLVILADAGEEQQGRMAERIVREFNRLYDRQDVTLSYDAAELN